MPYVKPDAVRYNRKIDYDFTARGHRVVEKHELEKAAIDAQEGNELVRERLIRHYKPYVINSVGHICKRYISWSEEEASIGLLAFNKAIDTYEPEKGRTFLNYVYVIIKRDLIDYFRKEERNRFFSLQDNEEESDQNKYDITISMEDFQRKQQSTNLIEEILELSEALRNYTIEFEELEHYSPKHKDTRETLTKLVSTFCEDDECVHLFITKKQMPTTLFSKKFGYTVKTIERYRKYIITLILLKLHPHWTHLHEYMKKEGS